MSEQHDAGPSQSKPPEESENAKPPLKNFWRILSFGSTLDRILMGVATLCAIGTGIALPLMNIVFGKLVGDFNGFFMPGTGVSKDEFRSSINKNVLYIVYLFIGKFVLGYIAMFSLRMTGLRISARMRHAYLSALFKQPISFVDKLPTGRPTTTITTSSNLIQAGISDKIAVLVQSLALVVGAYVVAFKYSWSITLVSSSALLFILLVYGIILPIYLNMLKKVELADEKASSIAGEVMGTIRTIVACGAEGKLIARYGEWIAESKRRGLQMSPLIGIQLSPTNFAMYCNFALTFWFGVRQYSRGHISDIGPVVIVIFSVLIVVTAVSFIATPIISLSKAITASTAFFEVLDAPLPKSSGLKEPEVSASVDIEFKDVEFSYPTRPDVKVLDKLSVCFPAGKITALVGPSGCGKSTIVGLLERWYNLESDSDASEQDNDEGDSEKRTNGGSITVDSTNIVDLDLKWWRSQIGLVQQEPFSFNASIYTNVSYGLVGSKWENEAEETKRQLVKEACQEAFADEFIDRLPEGYDTFVGENGIKLSGGQRQRLAIARSIIKRPPILILDEATSSIDVRGERIVQQALDRVSQNRTTITIAHRLSTIKKADKIILLKAGQAMEVGTHEELMAKEGLYHGLVQNQQLEMDEGAADPLEKDVEEVARGLSISKTRTAEKDTATEQAKEAGESYKPRSLINSIGLFLWEQKQHWLLYVTVVVGAAGCGAAYAIQSYLFANLVQTFQLTGAKLLDRANFWALMFFVLALGVAVFYFFLGYACMAISMYIASAYRQQSFENVIRKPIAFFDEEENSAGSLTSRLSTDPTQLQELLGPSMAFPLISVFNIIGSISIAFAFGWKLSLVGIFSAFPIIIFAMFIRIRYELQFEKMNAAVFADSSQFASEAIGAFRTVTSLTLEDTITMRYSDLLHGHITSAFRKARFATLIFAASDSIELPCMALCFWYGGQLLSSREYDVMQFFVIYIAIIMGGQAAGQFGSMTPNIAQASAAANRIISLRSKNNEDDAPSDVISDLQGGAKIVFKSVSFKYPTRDVAVFKNLSFTIEKGQFVALVGPSGCGKTTVTALLERFYDYQAGSITINGVELRSLEISAYRKSVSLVSQEPTMYQGSIRENILLGVDSASDEDIYQACRDAEIHEFIQSLPEGYNTDAGQRGLALSGGQKQRLSIARALIRKPHILLLDEATSSLDSESEKLVQAAIERTAVGRTVVVVAHRLATVQNADVIFVFGEGGIVESGNHRALLKKRGVYYEMCESQALDR